MGRHLSSEGLPNVCSRKKESGYTLTELMVVVLILGIALSIIGLNWYNISVTQTLNAATKQVESAITRAYAMAYNENRTYAVVFAHAPNSASEYTYGWYDTVNDNWVTVDASVTNEKKRTEAGVTWISIMDGTQDVVVSTNVTYNIAGLTGLNGVVVRPRGGNVSVVGGDISTETEIVVTVTHSGSSRSFTVHRTGEIVY